MRILTAILDTIRLNDVLFASSNWTSQISSEAAASLIHEQSVCAVLISLCGIAAEYNAPLEAVHADIDDDSCDRVE